MRQHELHFTSIKIFFYIMLNHILTNPCFKRRNIPLQPLGIFITLMKYFFSYRKVMYSDLQTIAPEQYMKTITKRLTDLHAVSVSF